MAYYEVLRDPEGEEPHVHISHVRDDILTPIILARARMRGSSMPLGIRAIELAAERQQLLRPLVEPPELYLAERELDAHTLLIGFVARCFTANRGVDVYYDPAARHLAPDISHFLFGYQGR
jgi:hypothetical protein